MKKSTFFNIFYKPSSFKKELGRKRYFSTGLLLIGALFVLLIVTSFFHPFSSRSREATLVIAYENDGRGRMFAGEVIDGMTILDALIVSSRAGQIELKYSLDSDGNLIIASLDGYDQKTSDKNLAFYLNQKKIDERFINSATIEPGDNIEIKLE